MFVPNSCLLTFLLDCSISFDAASRLKSILIYLNKETVVVVGNFHIVSD
jgi:hypothetical protein